jgi:secreted trypsin-like serine protease
MLISAFRRVVDEIYGLLGYYAASCGNCLPKFRDNLSVPSSLLTREDGTDTLSRNVGKQLPNEVAKYPRRPQISADNNVSSGTCHADMMDDFTKLCHSVCVNTGVPFIMSLNTAAVMGCPRG